MDGAKEDLVDMFIVHTTEEIQVSGALYTCCVSVSLICIVVFYHHNENFFFK